MTTAGLVLEHSVWGSTNTSSYRTVNLGDLDALSRMCTAEILGDEDFMERIRRGQEQSTEGRVRPLEDVLADLGLD
jgi:hypothetical protein